MFGPLGESRGGGGIVISLLCIQVKYIVWTKTLHSKSVYVRTFKGELRGGVVSFDSDFSLVYTVHAYLCLDQRVF